MREHSALKTLPDLLLPWYERHARSLPWRADPTPYKVLVSELMLQQTRVEAALPKAKHVFTHVEWHMTGWRVELAQRDGLQGDWHWTSDAQRGEGYAVPSAYRAYLG